MHALTVFDPFVKIHLYNTQKKQISNLEYLFF